MGFVNPANEYSTTVLFFPLTSSKPIVGLSSFSLSIKTIFVRHGIFATVRCTNEKSYQRSANFLKYFKLRGEKPLIVSGGLSCGAALLMLSWKSQSRTENPPMTKILFVCHGNKGW